MGAEEARVVLMITCALPVAAVAVEEGSPAGALGKLMLVLYDMPEVPTV